MDNYERCSWMDIGRDLNCGYSGDILRSGVYMKGIYMEYDVYKFDEVSPKELEALNTLGIDFVIDGDKKVIKIKRDTSEQDHQLCGDEDAIALVKRKMDSGIMREL